MRTKRFDLYKRTGSCLRTDCIYMLVLGQNWETWSTSGLKMLARAVTKWNKACVKMLVRLISDINQTKSLGNVPRTRTTQCGQTFSLEPCLRCREVRHT